MFTLDSIVLIVVNSGDGFCRESAQFPRRYPIEPKLATSNRALDDDRYRREAT
jgi:hypothetical protein